MPVGLLVVQASNGVNLVAVTQRHLSNALASVIADAFWVQMCSVRTAEFESTAKASSNMKFASGSFTVLGHYRATYSLVADVYVVVVTHVSDNPYSAAMPLDHARKLISSAGAGISKVKGNQYVELYFALARIIDGGTGTEVAGQKISELMPFTARSGDKPPEVGQSAWEQAVVKMRETERNISDIMTAPIKLPETSFKEPIGKSCGQSLPQKDMFVAEKADEELILQPHRTSGSIRTRKSVGGPAADRTQVQNVGGAGTGSVRGTASSSRPTLDPSALSTTPGRKRSASTDSAGSAAGANSLSPVSALHLKLNEPMPRSPATTARLRKSRNGITAVFGGPSPVHDVVNTTPPK